METHNHQPLITLASLNPKGQGPHGKEKHPSEPKDFRDKFFYFIINVNSSIDSSFESPIRMSRENELSICFDSLTSSFLVTMLVMSIDITSANEQIDEMTHIIAKLTKTIKEKNLPIAFLVNRIKA